MATTLPRLPLYLSAPAPIAAGAGQYAEQSKRSIVVSSILE